MESANENLLKITATGNKYFTSAHDVTNIDALIEKARFYKRHPLRDQDWGKGKKVGLLFLNPSMRTRLSTQIAAYNLGMTPIVLNVDNKEGWAIEFQDGAIMNGTKVEHIRDAAPIFGQFFDVLCIRTFPTLTDREADYEEYTLNQLIKFSGIPVVSMESATVHPLQSLADLMTIKEVFTGNYRPKIVLSWAPHVKPLPQSVSNSFVEWILAWGKADMVITHPAHYELNESFTKGAYITENQEEALKDADFICVKNWSAYKDYGKMYGAYPEWMLTEEKLKITRNAKILHCLPVRRNVELSDEVLDGPHSVTTQEAGNRIWAAQAVLSEIIN